MVVVGAFHQRRPRVVALRVLGRPAEGLQHRHRHRPVGRAAGLLGTPGQLLGQQRAQLGGDIVATRARQAIGHVADIGLQDLVGIHHFVSSRRNPSITLTWSRQAADKAAKARFPSRLRR